jgi:uncharacterized membrane protein YfcA
VPILVYLFKVDAEHATSYSLCIVGITSLVGSIRHYTLGNLQIKSALIFAIPSVLTLLLVRKIVLPLIPQHLFDIGSLEIAKNNLIMVVFAVLMIMASLSMIKKNKLNNVITTPNPTRLISIGLLVGLVTGFLGAGGGFLIIPALLFFAGLSMKQAVGTSLLIIFINSTIGFAGDVINGVQLDIKLLLTVLAMAIIGMMIGTQLSKKIDGAILKPIFGWFVLVMGIFIVGKELLFNH